MDTHAASVVLGSAKRTRRTAPGGPTVADVGTGPWRVVRVDKGAVLVVPADSAHDEAPADAVRATVDRTGTAASDEGRVVPAVGDLVEVDEVGRLARVLPRRSALVRDTAGRSSLTQVLAANVDVVLVVEHLDPDPDLGRVERLLTLAWRSGALPVVVLTKADLVPDPAGMAQDVAAAAIGVDVHVVATTSGEGLEPLRALLTPGRTLVVVGPSGAGKSTLVNALAGREAMATGERRADGRGRHTTTHRELVPLSGGAVLIDTPGLRAVGLVADADAIDHTFADIAALAERCRFSDCSHRVEPGCAVRAALVDGTLDERRYDSWRSLEREAAHAARRVDARLAAEERARIKRVTAAYRHRTRHPNGTRP